MKDHVSVRLAAPDDLERIAAIYASVFLGDRDKPSSALEWVMCWHNAQPLYQYFVVEVDGVVAGYAGWQMHGGFQRAEPVIELDQLGIDKAYQGKGLGPRLIESSVDELTAWIQTKNDRIESHATFVVWAYTLNFNAMNVYAKQFADGVRGSRHQFGDRAESMLRWRRPIIRPVRKDA